MYHYSQTGALVISNELVMDRFWRKVNKTDTCWLWTAGVTGRGGYGAFCVNYKMIPAHRYSYTILKGEIPERMELDHLCRNRRCVNPDHLEPVTREENWRRGQTPSSLNAKKTHCLRGHPFEGDNLIVRTGGRGCRECKSLYRTEVPA